MAEQILIWTCFAVVLLLCLPFRGARKLILEASGLILRIALLAVLAGGALLWFRPDLLPGQVVTTLFTIHGVRDLLPAPESPMFGVAAATLLAAVFLPLLAILDVTRRLAWRTTPLLVVEPTPAPAPAAVVGRSTIPLTGPRKSDRRAAAEKMADIGSRRPFRVADDLR
jgi:hypothetical protein